MHSFRYGFRFLVLVMLAAVAPGRLAAKEPGSELPWKSDFKQGLEEARKTGKRVFIDFSGVDCIPCRINEQKIFPLSEVRQRLGKFVLVRLYTDRLPNEMYPPEVQKKFGDDTQQQEKDAEPNRKLMERFGVKANPGYVVIEPTANCYEEVARYTKGKIDDKQAFVGFLDTGLEKKVEPSRLPNPTGKTSPTQDRIQFTAEVEPKEARPGQVLKLTITAKLGKGFHTYPLTMRSPDQKKAQLTRLTYEPNKALVPLWPTIKESDPKFVEEEGSGILLEHERPFTWTQDVLISPDAKPGKTTLAFTINAQVCDTSCVWVKRSLDVPITVKDGEPLPIPDALKLRSAAKGPEITVKPVPPDFKRSGGGNGTDSGLLAFILQGIFWGAVSLVTPCVFPMIPITVSFFLKQSEKEHHRPLLTALVYCSTIVVVLTIAAVALLSFFRAVSTHYLMNFGLGALFLFFALSLFGMYEIELPSGLARFTSSREGSGLLGTVFMALTFTIISFACVAPFLGGFGGTAASADLGFTKILLGGLAFSMTFAAPFLVLALFPALLKKLPKSGTWLNSVKVVMGFLELAAALKFCRQGELLITSQTQFFTYDLVLALYVGICFLCGLYLLCFYRLPHDTPIENLGVPRMLFGLAFISLGFYLLPAMWKVNDKGLTQRPNGVVFAWLDSFLLPEPVEDLPWKGNLEKALAEAKLSGKRVFVDFTGKTCTNCKYNERTVFTKPAVHELLLKYELLALYTDQVPDEFYTPEEQQEFDGGTTRQHEDAKKNLAFQKDKFNDERLPLYVILEPTADGGYREVARYKEGKINNVSAFTAFLRNNLGAATK